MQVLQMAGEFTAGVQEIAFGLSLVITGLFAWNTGATRNNRSDRTCWIIS